jgi:hypothetical protein
MVFTLSVHRVYPYLGSVFRRAPAGLVRPELAVKSATTVAVAVMVVTAVEV